MQPAIRQKIDVRIRWKIRRDLPEVLEIEHQVFEFPWVEEDFLICLRRRNCIGMVAEDRNNRICGYMLYELGKTGLEILNFAVDPLCHFRGVGRQMAEKLIEKLSNHRRTEINLLVRETNLAAQLFWQKLGFTAIRIFPKHYADMEDAYQFAYYLPDCLDAR